MDCSHAKSIPPINLTLPESGLCKTSQRACAKTNIFGHFQSETVMAKLEEFYVMKLFADLKKNVVFHSMLIYFAKIFLEFK